MTTPDDFAARACAYWWTTAVTAASTCDYATSISAGGLFIETESDLAFDSSVKLRFRLPSGHELHEIQGRVCWSNDPVEGTAQQAPGFGITFTSNEATNTLARELEDLEL